MADKARPKTGDVETCRHWAKGWCMRADACRFAHPHPPVPQGVPHDLLPILGAIARMGALRLSRSDRHEEMLRDVVEAAQGGGLLAVGYAVRHASRIVWAVALPRGVATLLTPFPVVPWRTWCPFRRRPWGGCARGTHTRRAWTRRHERSRRSDLLVLVAAHGGGSLDAVVGRGAELGPGWRRRGRLPGSAP